MSGLIKHLSFANVASALCLVLVLGAGVAHAAGLAKNSVKSAHIKDGQVKTADLAPNAVNGSKVKTDALTGSDVAPDTLTGADINEGSLAGVNAASVGGMQVKKINFQVPEGTANSAVPRLSRQVPSIWRVPGLRRPAGRHTRWPGRFVAISVLAVSSDQFDDTI